ncbi:MAG: 3-dehydroquinate synthase family protein, partial [Ilumatobacter sp.]
GRGAVDGLEALLGASRTVALVTQDGIPDLVDPASLGGRSVERLQIGRGEEHKSLDTVGELCSACAAAGMNRGDVVVAVGGGMVTDVAGFAAATFHRGIDVVHVPTTLLGMIDAAVGGKTGVNLPEGKNLVGSFWQPRGVICDLDALATLPEREVRCGNGEMAKYHFLTGDDLADLGEVDRIARCVEIKAEVVASDEREGGRRAVLNYGHTLAHALEIASGHELAHGEAVGIGLVFAAELARELGRIDEGRVADHRRVVGELYGLDTEVPAVGSVDRLMELMSRDKKAIDGLTFVLDGPAGVEPVAGVDPSVVADLLASSLTR